MIAPAPLLRLLRQNLRRNAKHMILSSFGIVVGIAAFVFFWGLSQGVSRVLLHDIFPIDRIEVIAPKTSISGVPMILDDDLVAEITARPEVERAFPKMKMAFPAKGSGSLKLGDAPSTPFKFEVGGFCDGVDPVIIAGDPNADIFRDWEADGPAGLTACGPAPDNTCPKDHYCGELDRLCHHRVPVLVSRTLVEIYNGSFAPSHNLPRIGATHEAMVAGRMKSMKFTIVLGESFIQSATEGLKAAPEKIEAQLIGISDKAMPIGMTVPIGYVKRWNERFAGERAAREYSSIIVDLKHQDQLASFLPWVKDNGYEQEESQAERIALVISIVTTLFLVIAFIICFISAVNIAHTFFMLVSERRREIGLLRAVGASRLDVWKIILGEAAVIGLVGGVLGTGIALAAAKIIDFYSAEKLPDYPFKPETYFSFSPWLLLLAIAFAILFCVLGAALPARKAAKIHPAQALVS